MFWDGENGGGKALMRMRDVFKAAHAWAGPYEEQVPFWVIRHKPNRLKPLSLSLMHLNVCALV